MSNIGAIGSNNDDFNVKKKQVEKDEGIKLEDISVFYETEQVEKNRSSFNMSFKEIPVLNSKEGQKFLNGLIGNKDVLCEKLGLSEEQYDSFACIALALASQETGMGVEQGYQDENNGFDKFKRDVGKFFDVLFGGASASSGLTQIKINDFMSEKLTDSEVNLLKELGIETSGWNGNNLYNEPDKAAIATIVVLNSIAQNYDDYKTMLKNEHENLSHKLPSNFSEEDKIGIGKQIIDNITNFYNNSSSEAQSEIRNAFKNWLLAQNDSVKGQRTDKGFNEEENLEILNNLLLQNGATQTLNQSDLNYIRYYLTSDTQEMNLTEYCAYAWNKGTERTGMQLDRTLADKIGTILSNPEDFDYDQFTVNVSTLAKMYAQQSNINQAEDFLNNPFKDYEFFGQDY